MRIELKKSRFRRTYRPRNPVFQALQLEKIPKKDALETFTTDPLSTTSVVGKRLWCAAAWQLVDPDEIVRAEMVPLPLLR